MPKWLFSRWNSTNMAGAESTPRRLAVLVCSVTATLLSTAVAQAAPDDGFFNDVEITPFIGYMFGGEFEDPTDNSSRDVQDETNYGIALNLNADGPERQYELLYSQQSTMIEGDIPLDLDVQYLQLGGIVNFMDNPRVVPFFGMTVGAARFSLDAPGTDTETELAFTIGGGLKIPLTNHVGIRFDTRAFVTLVDSDAQFFCVSAGGAVCRIRTRSGTLLQYSAMLGVTAGF